jgi:hypothetical protein
MTAAGNVWLIFFSQLHLEWTSGTNSRAAKQSLPKGSICAKGLSTPHQYFISTKLLLQRIQAAVNPEETHHKEFPKATTERSGTRRLESNSRISKQTQNDAETTTSDPDREATSPAKRSHQSPPSLIVTDARLQTAAGNITQRSDQHRSM